MVWAIGDQFIPAGFFGFDSFWTIVGDAGLDGTGVQLWYFMNAQSGNIVTVRDSALVPVAWAHVVASFTSVGMTIMPGFAPPGTILLPPGRQITWSPNFSPTSPRKGLWYAAPGSPISFAIFGYLAFAATPTQAIFYMCSSLSVGSGEGSTTVDIPNAIDTGIQLY